MKRKKYYSDHLVRDDLVFSVINGSKTVADACTRAKISKQTFYRWRKNYLDRTSQMQTNGATKVEKVDLEINKNDEIPAIVYFLEEQLQKHLKAADKLRRAIEMLTSKDA